LSGRVELVRTFVAVERPHLKLPYLIATEQGCPGFNPHLKFRTLPFHELPMSIDMNV
jgi:hypothetical protein